MKKTLALIFILAAQFTSHAQKPSDLELWTGASFQYRMSKKWSIAIEEQFRFNDTISSLQKSFTEAGLKFRLGKGFAIAGNYRYSVYRTSANRHRVSGDLSYGFDKKGFPLVIDIRSRFQYTFNQNRTFLRNKIALSYKLSKLVDPYIQYEAFFRFNGKNEFRINRYTLGLDWRLMKELNLTTFFRIEDEINIKSPTQQKIIGLSLDYTLKYKKKKD